MVYPTRRFCFKSCLVLFCSFFFSPFSIAITLLGEERANLNAFGTFVRFALVCFCLFSLPPGVWEGQRLVIVALPGRFSYFFSYFLLFPFVILKKAFCFLRLILLNNLRNLFIFAKMLIVIRCCCKEE